MLLPQKWIENSIEVYIYQHTSKSQIIYWVVLAFIILAFALLPFIYIDISIQSNGVVRPVTEKTDIKSNISGLISEVYICEGQKVKKGDVLLRFHASSSDEKIAYQNNRLKDIKAHIADLKLLSKGGKPTMFQSPVRLQEYHVFISKKQELQVAMEQAKREYDRERQLFDKSLVSEEEYEKYLFTYKSKSEELTSLVESQLSTWQTELNSYENQYNEIFSTQRQEKAEVKDMYEVRSPVSGTIEQFSGIYRGSNVQAGQTMANVSPDSTVYLEAYVSPNDIGYIYVNMPIKAQITSFNYNEWGTIQGTVVYVSSDCMSDEKNAYFKVKCQLQRNFLVMKKTGKKGYLKKGMKANVHFMITKRSLFDILYQNIDEWVNPTQYIIVKQTKDE